MQIRQQDNKFIGCEAGDCGHIEYRQRASTLEILSTYVPPALRGGGRAAELTRYALRYARANDLQVKPVCSYTRRFLQQHHADYADLLEH